MTIIYLVRHGQASFGASSYDKLSTKGELQAQNIGQYFQNLLKEQPYVMAGAMQRHQQTAQFALSECFPDTQIQTDANWNEFNHEQVFSKYEIEHQTQLAQSSILQKQENPRAYLAKIFSGAIERWTNGEFDYDYDESWLIFKSRVETALESLLNEVKTNKPRYVVVFTSGGVISVVTGLLLGLSAAKTFELNWSVVNTGLTTLKVNHSDSDDNVQLVSFNEHLFIKEKSPELLTWI